MTAPSALVPAVLCARCEAESLRFDTTADLDPLDEPFGQARAVEAARFALAMSGRGYNLFVHGPSGAGKHALLQSLVEEVAATRAIPPDWCYVQDFAHPLAPRALSLPAGRGAELVRDMEKLVEDLRAAIPAAFENEQYRARLQEIEEAFKAREEALFHELEEEADKRGIAVVRMPSGVVFAPVKSGEVLGPDDFEKLSDEDKAKIKESITTLQATLQRGLRQLPQAGKEARAKVRELDREVSRYAVEQTIEELKKTYVDLPKLAQYIDQVLADVIENADDFRKEDDKPRALLDFSPERRFDRYRVNLVVDNGKERGAPVVYEDRPGAERLVGRMDHRAQFGTLTSDFTMIKAGALHRANGGYLILDARKLLTQPYAWDVLKRVLFAGEIRIESLSQLLGVSGPAALEPEPIPLDVKVVLIGDRTIYYLLCEVDPDVGDLFKVTGDFAEEIERTPESELGYARLIAAIEHRRGLRPFARGAVARLIEVSARRAGDAGKLSTSHRFLNDLLREADYFAGARAGALVERQDVERAIDAQIKRQDRVRERVHEAIVQGTVLIDTRGSSIGQVNALSVISLGDFAFGTPTRITATVRVGDGKVVDIEREVDLGGAIHSKGVLILSSYFAARYSRQFPLSLSASLVFEQSYAGVEGDSASMGELCALLSALADAPIKQSIAVTGSVNQHGQVQAIGGVNEKIEGFFDVCSKTGLTGDQGVIIPAANVRHLMLRRDVVEACEAGRFRVYPVVTVDDALEILTGVQPGQEDESGDFPEDSLNARVLGQLLEFAIIAEGFAKFVKVEGDEEVKGAKSDGASKVIGNGSG